MINHVVHFGLKNDLNEIDSSFFTLNDSKLINLLLYGNDKFDDKKKHFHVHHKIH